MQNHLLSTTSIVGFILQPQWELKWLISNCSKAMGTYNGSSNFYVFPHELLPWGSSLKHLSLLRCVLSPPSDHFDRFKQLKTLHLHYVQVYENFMKSLFSVCLFLEILSLELCTMFSSLIITGPPLSN